MKTKLRFLRVLFLCQFFVLALGRGALAAQSPDGITVSPAFQQVTVPAGSTEQPITFTIKNDKKTAQGLSLSVADFNTLNESGGLFFVGTNPTQLQQKYGLAKWVSLPENQLTLAPGQTVKINAEILNLPTLAAGGHYGALMISLAGGSSNQNSIGLKPIASSLLFATKQPGDTHHLSLSNVYIKHSVFSLPKSVILRFYNDGNTHVVPRGIIQITDPKGKVISRGIINQNSDIILPVTFRQYAVPLVSQSMANLPGSYKLTVDFRFDGIDQFRSYQVSFKLLPAAYAIVLAIIVIVICSLEFISITGRRRAKKSSSKKITK